MTATITPTPTTGDAVVESTSTALPVWLVGAVSGVAAAVATTVVALAWSSP